MSLMDISKSNEKNVLSKKKSSNTNVFKTPTKTHSNNNHNKSHKLTSSQKHSNRTMSIESNSEYIEPLSGYKHDLATFGCKNKKACVSLKPHLKDITQFFEYFKNLNLIDNSKIKKIGKNSKNGFIYEFIFRKSIYQTYAVLKSSANKTADNLIYEYYVGKMFVNNLVDKFPCFLETYNLFKFTNRHMYEMYKNNSSLNNISVKDTLVLSEFNNWNKTCIDNDLYSILIQHFDEFFAFSDLLTPDKINLISNEILFLLYQIYFPLGNLNERFTHYDLHTNNVFLHKPYNNKKFILLRYHTLNGKIFEFPTEYIAKIIDYGRCYFYNSKMSSSKIVNEVCNAPNCLPHCGAYFGYGMIINKDNDSFIHSYKSNISHDLRLIYIVNTYMNNFLKTKYNFDLIYETDYGTPEIKENKLNERKITNVKNFKEFLEKHLSNELHLLWKKYNKWEMVAEIDIYSDNRPYVIKYPN